MAATGATNEMHCPVDSVDQELKLIIYFGSI